MSEIKEQTKYSKGCVECNHLILPRWDIMYCPYCKRKLAGYEIKHPPKEKSFIQKIKDIFTYKPTQS